MASVYRVGDLIAKKQSMIDLIHDFSRECKFMCLFIAKIWWMIPRVGKSASDIPMETQMLLLEVDQESVLDVAFEETPVEPSTGNKFYVFVLPVLDGAFRTSLQGTKSNELQFCYESGWCSN